MQIYWRLFKNAIFVALFLFLLRDADTQFNAAMATFENSHDAAATVSSAPRLFSAGLQSEDFADFKVCCRIMQYVLFIFAGQIYRYVELCSVKLTNG